MPQIIDALIVTLGLDPKKFGTEAEAAQKRLDKFDATVKKLTGSETQLSDSQKATIELLRQQAVAGGLAEREAAKLAATKKKAADDAARQDAATKQRDDKQKLRDQASVKRREETKKHKDELAETRKEAERTKKELAATDSAGKALWGTLEGAAVTFGAALGITTFGAAMGRAISDNASFGRTAPNAGMRPSEMDAWFKAAREVSGGDGSGVVGTLGSLSDQLQGLAFGKMPSFMPLIAQSSRYNGGKPLSMRGPDGHVLSPDQLLEQMADPVHNMGPAKAHALWVGHLIMTR